jgi:hypothetical protein
MIKYYGDQTRWFIGDVVDIGDPLELGRIRVRIHGLHGSDIENRDLPWAQVVAPITEGGTTGFGGILGIKQDALVFGMFLDGENSQLPLVLGSMPKFEEYAQGGRTTNVLAREELAAEHSSRINRQAGRLNSAGDEITYKTATAAKLSTINEKSEAFYGNDDWVEPLVAGGVFCAYPFNQVKETLGGHIEEVDDTPGAKRYHRYHPAGSFVEVLDDGSRTIKIVGKDYEMFLNGKNVYVNGNLNLTVAGDKRELIQGNYHLEVEGDMTMNLHQSIQTKVEMNQETEIGGFRVTNVKEDDNLTILNGDQNFNIVTGSRIENITTNDTRTVQGNITSINYGTNTMTSVGNMAITVANGTLTNTASGIITLETASNMVFDIDGTHTITAPTAAITYTDGDIVVDGISHVGHTHTDPAGLSGSETSTPN